MTICNFGSIILYSSHGPVAQLGAHYIRIVGVGSSNLLGSTKKTGSPFGGPVFLSGEEIRTIQCSSPGDCCLPPAGRRQLQSVPNLLGSTRNTGIPPGDLFFYRERRFEPYNAAVRGTAACRRLDGGSSKVYRISSGPPETPASHRGNAAT